MENFFDYKTMHGRICYRISEKKLTDGVSRSGNPGMLVTGQNTGAARIYLGQFPSQSGN